MMCLMCYVVVNDNVIVCYVTVDNDEVDDVDEGEKGNHRHAPEVFQSIDNTRNNDLSTYISYYWLYIFSVIMCCYLLINACLE